MNNTSGGSPGDPPATNAGGVNADVNNVNNTNSKQQTYLYEAKDDGPFYVFIESLNLNEKGVGRMHPMSIGQLLKKSFPSTEITNLKKNGANRIKVQVPTREKANEIIQSKELKDKLFKAYVPKFILFRQGIIRNVDPNITEQELLEEITPLYSIDATVTEVRRFNRRTTDADGNIKYIPTGTIQVTFRAQSIPTHVSIFYVRCEVEKFVPKVLQCINCLRFGHTARFCKGSARCSKCGENHSDNDCTKEVNEQKCIHCNGPHSSRVNFKNSVCPEVEKQKSIKNLMVDENITFFEAKSKLSSNYSRLAARIKTNVTFEPETRQYQSETRQRDSGIQRIPTVRKAMFTPPTPDRSQTKKRMRQESPKNELFRQKCQEITEGYRYDATQFPNGVCLTGQSGQENINKDNQSTKCTLEFENVDKLTQFISSVYRNSVDLVGSNRQITQQELQGVIEKALLSKDSVEEEDIDMFSSNEDSS
uniref:Uncharacterized protein n=1 Tax=Cacopsylla melanoneura TaxID=428564 RepID=A0A8D9FHM3_9HEMI